MYWLYKPSFADCRALAFAEVVAILMFVAFITRYFFFTLGSAESLQTVTSSDIDPIMVIMVVSAGDFKVRNHLLLRYVLNG